MVNAFLSAKVKPLTPVAAKVETALLVALSKVTLPPSNNKLEATTYPLAPSVTFPHL